MLIACLLFAVGQLGFNAVTLDTWMDEGKYLMKGYRYFTGKIAPYSTVDPSLHATVVLQRRSDGMAVRCWISSRSGAYDRFCTWLVSYSLISLARGLAVRAWQALAPLS